MILIDIFEVRKYDPKYLLTFQTKNLLSTRIPQYFIVVLIVFTQEK